MAAAPMGGVWLPLPPPPVPVVSLPQALSASATMLPATIAPQRVKTDDLIRMPPGRIHEAARRATDHGPARAPTLRAQPPWARQPVLDVAAPTGPPGVGFGNSVRAPGAARASP